VEREKEHGTVVEEIQKGYLLHDRLLRPSLVNIAKSGKKDEK
jgi:molecular chaperone GrpE